MMRGIGIGCMCIGVSPVVTRSLAKRIMSNRMAIDEGCDDYLTR